MNLKKKLLALGLSLAMVLSLAACGQKAAEPEQPEEPAQTEEPEVEAPDGTEADTAHFRIAALKGPTAMGLVKLMKDNDGNDSHPRFHSFHSGLSFSIK